MVLGDENKLGNGILDDNKIQKSVFEPREFPLTEADYKFICEFVYKHVGIVLHAEKQAMVYARLTRRLRVLNFTTFKEYCHYLAHDGAQSELPNLINAITTNLTRFFREDHHFDHMRQTVLEPLYKLGKMNTSSGFHEDSRRLRIWSAGCSTGEEPYSIAMTAKEAAGNALGNNLSITATDVDTNVLDTGKKGIYKLSDTIPQSLLNKYTTMLPNQMFQFKDEIRQLIHFQQFNFLHPIPFKDSFHVIFCRNVVIYFDKETQTRLFNHMADLLVPGGWLYIGHSESLYNICNRFKLVGRTIYQKMG